MPIDKDILEKFNRLPQNKQRFLISAGELIEAEEDDDVFAMNATMLKFAPDEISKLKTLIIAKIQIKKLNTPQPKNKNIESMLLAGSYPKNCKSPRDLYINWPRDTVTLEMLKKKNVISQVIFELDISNKSVQKNPEILNEYECRINFIETQIELQNLTKEKTIKAARNISIDQLVEMVAEDKWYNEQAKIQIRCADVREGIHRVTIGIRKCKDLLRKVEYRMVHTLQIATKLADGSLSPKMKRRLWNLEIKAPAMFEDYIHLVNKTSDTKEDLESMVNILNGIQVRLINRTMATTQTFGSLASQGMYMRLKDKNRRKRVHFFKMEQYLKAMPLQLLVCMYKLYGIKHVKVHYERGEKAIYLDMKQYIGRRVYDYESKYKMKFWFVEIFDGERLWW
eukprot:768_1